MPRKKYSKRYKNLLAYLEKRKNKKACIKMKIQPDRVEEIDTGSSEMNAYQPYTNIPTPPMSSSEGSRSPLAYTPNGTQIVPQYFAQGMILEEQSDFPHLEILEQPVEKFRFRYKSEMAGTHGSLCGKSSERNRKQTFPTVRLKNFNRPAVVRCSLYQYNSASDQQFWQPHAHRLVQKRGNEEVDDPHDKRVEHPQNQDIVFNNMGIIHTAKRFIVEELFKKKKKLKVEEIKMSKGREKLNTAEMSDLEREATEEAKSINLNIVCLRFDAFEEVGGVLTPVCAPIYSHAINNLKSALTGELKITRMSRCSSPACGNKELFLLVEKVTKKNIKIRFFEMDEDDNELWSAYGKFHDNDVHHQYAIVATIPAYKDVSIETDVKIYIELERPSDGAKSAPLDFTYHPDRMSRRKRPRMYDSSTSFSSSEVIPSTLQELEPFFNSKDLEEVAKAVNSEEFQEFKQLFHTYDMDMPYQTDNTHKLNTTNKTWPEAEKQIMRVLNELESFFKTNPPEKRIVTMLEALFGKRVDANGNNALHLAYIHYPKIKTEKLADIIKLLIKCKLWHLLNATNKDQYTLLHLAVLKGCDIHLPDLVKHMDISIKNDRGFTALHLAVQTNSLYEEILKSPNKKFIDITCDSGETALQLAVLGDNFKAVKALCEAGANVNVIDRKSGGNLMHMCINNMNPTRVEIAEYLIKNTNIDLTKRNFAEVSCLAAARSSNEKLGEKICVQITEKLISMGLYQNESSIKEEPESDDEVMEIETTVKLEHLSEDEIRELYGQIIQFTAECLDKISQVLNVEDKWKELPPLLDLHYVLTTHLFDGNENPSAAFIKFALANGCSVYQIRTNLVHLNEFELVKYIDDMAFNSD